MNKTLRYSLLGMIVLVAVVIVGMAAVLLMVDAESLRPSIEESLSDATGRAVALGTLSVVPGFGVRVTAQSLEIGPPLDPSVEPGLEVRAEDVRLSMAILPVLRGEVDVRSIRFDDGVIGIDRQPIFSGASMRSRMRRKADGRISFKGSLSGTADLFGGAIAELQFDTMLDGDVLEIISVDADIGPGTVIASGEVTGIERGDYRITITARSEFGSTEADGRLEARFGEDGTRITFDLSSRFVDFDQLAEITGWIEDTGEEVTRDLSGGIFPAAHASEVDSPGDETAVPLLATGTLEAARGRFAGLDLEKMNVGVRFDGRRLAFEDANFNLYGGEHTGRFGIDVEDENLPFTLSGHIAGVDLDSLITAFSPDLGGSIAGTAGLSLGISGRAGDASPEGTVKGDARLEVVDGILSGGALLQQISDKLLGVADRKPGAMETPFERLTADFRVGERILTTGNLEFRSPDLDLDGEGTIGFDGMLDLDMTAAFSREATDSLVRRQSKLKMRVDDSGRLTIPLQVEGNLVSPELSLDLERILEEGLGRELKKRLRSLFRRDDQ